MFNPKDHLRNIQGKDYLEVKWRLVWFREDQPTGSVQTEVINHEPVLVKASVYNGDGQILATGIGTAKMQGVARSRPYEGAETAAIGRALAHAGYGTQFTGEDEGDNIADSPVERKPAPKKELRTNGNGNAPMLNPQFLVDNELSSNVPHAAAILNGLKLGGQKATDDNLKLIKKYRELKDGGMDDEHAFIGALS